MRGNSCLVVVAALLPIALIMSSAQVGAVERASGDFYTYDFEMEFMGISVSGEISYEFEGTDSLMLGGDEYAVNVMTISGELSGGVMMVDLLSATIEGTAYETRDGAAIAKEETVFLVNMTLGTGQFAQVSTLVEEVVSTHAPPLLLGFNPASASPGDEWTETVLVSVTNSTWLNGELWGDPESSNTTVVYTVSIAPATENVATPAGNFECLKITASNDTEGSMEYWWSAEVGNFVRIFTYEAAGQQPVQSLELKDYSHERPADTMLIVLIGGTVLAIAVVVMVLVLKAIRRRPPTRELSEPPKGLAPPSS